MEALRTPEERFDRLPSFPWEPRYREWEGLRLAYVDEGEGCPRGALARRAHVVAPVAEGRGVAARVGTPLHPTRLARVRPPDKPVDDEWYSYARHTDAVATLLVDLDCAR